MRKQIFLLVCLGIFLSACGQNEENASPTAVAQTTDVVETPTPNVPTPTVTQTSTPTLTVTYTPTATNTPQPTNTATAVPTNTPTATATATFTPTSRSTAVPTLSSTSAPVDTGTDNDEDTGMAVLSAIQSQLHWLDILINSLEINFTGFAGTVTSADRNVNCDGFLYAFDQIKAAPTFDVQASDIGVQNAYNVYRAGLDGIITNNDIIQWGLACQTAIQEGQENLVPSDFQRGILRQPMDEGRNLLNQARSIIENQ